MPNILPFVNKSFSFDREAIKENRRNLKDPDYFRPSGIQTFFGEQGDGKTITLIHFYKRIAKRYPKAIVVSNIILKDRTPLKFNNSVEQLKAILSHEIDTVNEYIYYSSLEEYALVNQCVRNGKYGVIVITDEYQNYFSNQDSSNVPPWVIHQAAQNRKQKRLHLVTSQDYDQLVKAVRRRSDIAFRCKSFALPFGLSAGPFFTVYWAFIAKKLEFDNNGKRVDGSRPLKMGFFFQSQALRDSYDTNQVVFTGSQADGVFLASQPTVSVKPTGSSLKPKKKGLIFRHR